MTPFGARLRALRAERGMTLQELAAQLQVSAAYLSALEHGQRGAPRPGLMHQVCEALGLIWDQAEDRIRTRELSVQPGSTPYRRRKASSGSSGRPRMAACSPSIASNK